MDENIITADELDGYGVGEVREIDGKCFKLIFIDKNKYKWVSVIKATDEDEENFELGDCDTKNGKNYRFAYNEITEEYEWIEEKTVTKKVEKADWISFGFDKTYEGPLNEDHVRKLLAGGNKEQREAVRYLTYYARVKNKDNDLAKTILVCDIINKKDQFSPDIWEFAYSAFYMIFKAFIGTQVNNHYASMNVAYDADKIDDANMYLWQFVLENIGSYNPEKAKINTYFGTKLLHFELIRHDSNMRGFKISQPTQARDAAVLAIKNQLENEGQVVDAQTIWLNSRHHKILKSCDTQAIQNSLLRLRSMEQVSINSEEGEELTKSFSQKAFEEPEEKVLKEEKRRYLIKAFNMLSDVQKEILFCKTGVKFNEDGQYIDAGTLADDDEEQGSKPDTTRSNKAVAAILKMSETEVEREFCALQNIFINNVPHTKKSNSFLNNRGPIFTEDKDMINLEEYLLDIDDILFEDEDGKFTKAEEF